MSKERISLINYDSPPLIIKTHDRSSSLLSSPPVFILCDTCYWCATYFDKTRIPRENKCPQCNANNNELTSFPIMPNESFTFIYNDKQGLELGFKPRLKGATS
jgi:predicted Zn-ribbon and HTH transcriptional regulator